MKRFIHCNAGMMAACLALLVGALCVGGAWADVLVPLHANIKAPENGFSSGAAATLALSAWVPEGLGQGETSLEMTLSASGVAKISGAKSWRFDNITIGQVQQAAATVWIEGDGEGEWRLEVASFNADGERMWGASDSLFVLKTPDDTLLGKSSDYHLLLEKLEKDLAKGRLSGKEFEAEKKKLLRGEELDLQKALKGLPKASPPAPVSIPKVVDTTQVSGKITYTHRTGRAAGANQFAAAADARPLTEMLVEFYDIDGATETKLATTPAVVRTDATGSYANVTVPGKRGDGNAVNLQVQFIFDSPAATIGTDLASVNYIAKPAFPVTAATHTVDHVVDNTALQHLRRAHIHETALFCYNNTRALITQTGVGTQPEKIMVHFPNPAGPNGSYFWSTGGDHIAIGQNHAFDWDVFTHEYGHYMQKMNDTARNPGGKHYIDGNLSGFNQGARTLTKEQGIQMAWAEGWPTYYGTFLQISNGAGAFGIYGAGDLVYTDTGNNFAYHLETNADLARPNGEDVELAVQRILWDFADQPQDENDEVTFGHQRMWTLLHSAPKPLTLNEFRAKMDGETPPGSYTAGTQQQMRVKYGAIYHDLGVGPAPTAPAEGFTGATPPKFTWQRKGAGAAPSYRFNKFNVQFYDKDFKAITFTSPEIPTAAGALTNATSAEWTPTQEQWDQIIAGGEVLHWGVLGSHDGAPATGPYLGLTRTIGGASIAFVIDNTGSMGGEIEGVRQALTLFVDMLRILDLPVNPKIEVVSFWDDVSHGAASNDLDVIQTQINAMGAWGGGDCPEASAQALASAAKNMPKGGTIIFATDASPHKGYDLAGIKTALRAKGITLNQIVTGDCEASSPDGWAKAIQEASCNPDYVPGDEVFAEVEWWSDVVCLDCPEDDSAGRAMTPNILKTLGDWTLPPVSSVAAFTDLASASPKGHFLYMPEAKWGGDGRTAFVNTVANTALAAVVPTILATQPRSGAQGTTLDVLIGGGSTNFRNNSAVAFSGTGITVNNVSAATETELVANITIAPDAELGFRDITVTTVLGAGVTETAGGTGQFQILAENTNPALLSVVPRTIAQDTVETLTISGANTHFENGVTTVEFGEGITPGTVTVTSPTNLQVQVTVAADAPVGFRRITVRTGDEVLVLNNTLVLVETLGLAGDLPSIESVLPRWLPRGASNVDLNVTAVNTNFVNGETTAGFSGTGVTVVGTTVAGPTTATVRVNVAAGAELGARDVVLTTGGETAVLIAGAAVVDLITAEQARTRLLEGFDAADTNSDGLLSLNEASAAAEGLTLAIFDQLDSNGDGSLDMDELSAGGCGCGCNKSDFSLDGLKKRLGDLFLAGLALGLLAAWSTRRK